MLVINRLAWVSPISAFTLLCCKNKEKHGKEFLVMTCSGYPFTFFSGLGCGLHFCWSWPPMLSVLLPIQRVGTLMDTNYLIIRSSR
jgi:hypothetical protein